MDAFKSNLDILSEIKEVQILADLERERRNSLLDSLKTFTPGSELYEWQLKFIHEREIILKALESYQDDLDKIFCGAVSNDSYQKGRFDEDVVRAYKETVKREKK